MNRDAVRRLLDDVTTGWAADPGGDVVWAGDYEGRRGVRVRQRARDFTTVWFRVGERTLQVEAFVLAAPPPGRSEEAFRQCLARNVASRRLHFALDPRGDVVLVGRVPLGEVDGEELELLLGEAHEAVEVAWPALVRAMAERERLP